MSRNPGNRRWGKVVRIADVNRVFWDAKRFVLCSIFCTLARLFIIDRVRLN